MSCDQGGVQIKLKAKMQLRIGHVRGTINIRKVKERVQFARLHFFEQFMWCYSQERTRAYILKTYIQWRSQRR